ncbi:uncharacterized protein EDB91DRAFT_865522 [Suillus paluster]|uniref:uncharacterized protein n=1 Tax=Suillus paluster TaxID=48578 RepID=UPI001B86F948|nr:uncharacterized protein EDB91DRAFT_865522 [Suillus paluster]KAG1728150.1 hypothetical protein EDB91DRAFT_865522 [Suillus paluster]
MNTSETQEIWTHSSALVVANKEITFIWCRPKALSAMLFLVNRYVALVSNVYGLIINFLPVSHEVSCSKYLVSRELLIFLQQGIVCVILTLRTYALYGCSKRLLIWMVIIVLGLAGVASAGMFAPYSSTTIDVPGVNCYESNNTAETAVPGWHGICKTRGSPRLSLIMSRRNILDIIFQDGAMYFAAMTLFNIPNILTFYCASDITKSSLATFTSCMSVTLISRLMLNLHKFVDTGIFSTIIRDNDPGSTVFSTRISVNTQSAIFFSPSNSLG